MRVRTDGTGGAPTPPVRKSPLCLRVRHYSLATEKCCLKWLRRFMLANGKRHPRDRGRAEVEAFLSGLAVEGKVAPEEPGSESPFAPGQPALARYPAAKGDSDPYARRLSAGGVRVAVRAAAQAARAQTASATRAASTGSDRPGR